MLTKETGIQFLLFEGASAKLDGLNIARGWQKLGYNVHWWFPRLGRGNLLERPEYVFTVKPREDDLLLKFKSQGAKIVQILEDETLVPDRRKIYDFLVSSSYGWKASAALDYPNIPCYLVRDEQDYYTTKVHTPDSFRIVTAGHMENLKCHFNILPILGQRYLDVTIVSNWIDRDVFPYANFEKWVPKFDYFDEQHDTIMTEQFKKYDVAVVTQYASRLSRNSSRLRTFIYAGLPVVAIDSENHRDLWLNGEDVKVSLVKKETDWLDHLKALEDYKVRQEIADYNYEKVKKWGGIEQAALTFVKAIEQYEGR